jgi:two-component system, NarL family, nitrate/nitrite response regulator NarL
MFQRRGSTSGFRFDEGSAPYLGVISDVALVRDGLGAQLARDGRVRFVGACAPDEPLPSSPSRRPPNVVVLDFGSGGARDCVERLRSRHPTLSIVGVAVGKSSTALSDWAAVGVCGFVEDDGTIDDLVRAVLLVSRGHFSCSPRAAATIVAGLIARDHPPLQADLRARLTPREAEILVGLKGGATNKEIARHLGISGATVKNHVHRVLETRSPDGEVSCCDWI